MFGQLEDNEKNQLTDFIISTYNFIDYKAAIRRFGSYDKMITAMHSTTGSEYDIAESFVGKSDKYYANMISIVKRETGVKDIHEILGWDDDKKWELYLMLRSKTMATGKQIAKFLRMPLKTREM